MLMIQKDSCNKNVYLTKNNPWIQLNSYQNFNDILHRKKNLKIQIEAQETRYQATHEPKKKILKVSSYWILSYTTES